MEDDSFHTAKVSDYKSVKSVENSKAEMRLRAQIKIENKEAERAAKKKKKKEAAL